MLSFLRVAVSALIIGIVSTMAKKHPLWAGWIAALPLVTLLSIAWLLPSHPRSAEITRLISGVLLGMIPTALLLMTTWISVKKGVGILPSVGLGVII